MGSRKFARFCKFVLYLCVAMSVYYLIAKCRDFDPDLKSKLANVKDIQGKLSKFLAKWNVMAESNEERGGVSRAKETKEGENRAMNGIRNDSNFKHKETSLNTLNTFVSLLEKRQRVEAKLRDDQFDKFMSKLTNVFQLLPQQTEYVNQEAVRSHPYNPSTSAPKTTASPQSTKHTSFEEKTTAKSGKTRTSLPERPTTTTSPNKQFPTSTRKYTMQAILERQTQVFLDKMKTAGIQYKSANVFYPKKQGKRSAGIFYREVLPPGAKGPADTTVFLLHGKKYDSKLWLSIGTLYVLGTSGFRVIAVDLPGYGGSKSTPELSTSVERFRLLAAMMLHLAPDGRRVLVSPGKSGIYSVPLVMSVPSILKGIVFIAPNFTSNYPASRYEKISLETLIIFGARDETALHVSSLDDLEHLPNRKIYSLPNAKHDCYLDQTETFHRLLKTFLVNGNGTVKKVLRN